MKIKTRHALPRISSLPERYSMVKTWRVTRGRPLWVRLLLTLFAGLRV